MFIKKAIAISVFLGLSSLPLLASATGILIRTNCVHPTRGEESCELEFPDPNDTDVWEIIWQDDVRTRIKLSDSSGIERWDPQSSQWSDSDSIGFCFERKCVHFPRAVLNSIYQQSAVLEIDCVDLALGEGTCRAEGVPETKGIRVYWPDNSIEHYRFDGAPFSMWSHSENGWINVSDFGMCFDQSCILFDAETLNQWNESAQ
ncbi:MAG: hypothetical protein AAGD25_15765 [Cyanobacteria bacterium P01_F01_bin.150]